MALQKSFKREIYLDWTDYNTLEIRLRGDGRSYMLNISCSGYFDVMWHDVFAYPLYTRGGPHWQLTRVRMCWGECAGGGGVVFFRKE